MASKGQGKSHGFGIQTRQKDDDLWRSSADLVVGTPLALPARLVQGYGSVKFLITSSQAMRLRVEQAPTGDGPWTETDRADSVLSTSGTGQVICASIGPCGPYARAFVDNIGAATATDFEFTALGHPIGEGVVGGSSGGVASNVSIVGNGQVQTVEALPLLAGGVSFDGGSKDNINFEAMSVSLTVSSTLGTTVVVKFQQRASGADTFRDADSITVPVPAGGAPGPLVNFDRVWSVTRRFGRIRVENTGANPLTVAECVVVQKPIS